MSEATVKRRLREDRFVAEYLKDFNGVEAIQRSGFTGTRPDVAGSKMLMRPRVREQLAKRAGAVLTRADVSIERIVQEAAAIAFSDPRHLVDEHNHARPIHTLTDEAAASVADLEFDADTGKLKKLKRWNKVEAIKFLGQFKGMTQPDAPAPISVFNIQINL